jgi:hypothetical protein
MQLGELGVRHHGQEFSEVQLSDINVFQHVYNSLHSGHAAVESELSEGVPQLGRLNRSLFFIIQLIKYLLQVQHLGHWQ